MEKGSSPRKTESWDVVVLGAGFAGLAMGRALLQDGVRNFVILEQADDVGGTWRDNTYPGAACDVPSHLYSYSFRPRSDWTRAFAPQAEIQEYLKDCADAFGLRPWIRFGAYVEGARFDEDAGRWELRLADGREVRARAVISGCGGLSRPLIPDIPGLRAFEGDLFHTARWNHDVPLRGRRVAVIGTGASAIQVVPAIASEAEHLTVYQRTPPWITPRPDRAFSARERALFARIPALRQAYRLALYWGYEMRVLGLAIHPGIMRIFQKIAERHIERSIADPELRRLVTPDYLIGCKRILLSDDYYPALCRENVTLVPHALAAIEGREVIDAGGGRREVDAIIAATGFYASESAAPFPIEGRAGLSLDEAWAEGAEAYKGTAVSGFPNLFLLVGPNTGLGHTSMILQIESQVAYVRQCIGRLLQENVRALEVREDAQARWNESLQRRLEGSVWAEDCNAWYTTQSGKNTTLWPGFTWEFRLRTRRFDEDAWVLRR